MVRGRGEGDVNRRARAHPPPPQDFGGRGRRTESGTAARTVSKSLCEPERRRVCRPATAARRDAAPATPAHLKDKRRAIVESRLID